MIIPLPPPPPPVYQVFIPIVSTYKPEICDYRMCDYVYNDNKARFYLTDEGLYNEFANRSLLNIEGNFYMTVQSGNSKDCPDNTDQLMVLYIHMDGLYYWTLLDKLP